ncbi:probable inactive purple acid phosphatase 27 isoform X3 [Macadamia integrifolia]|uniref:probable inactive purple acid phosphatase 27 isoform X3 n=1 Tax=Macadamia integrifolia TaxID=60698 RepID=UPI001C532998|nr:probable inactive purple acid phosphatase 27 isoform X3 [Macadamia integrifolia]
MYSFISFNFSSFFFTFFLLFGSLTALSPTTSSPSSSSSSSQLIIDSTAEFQGYTAISEFRLLNRRTLFQCIDPNPFLQVNISAGSGSGLSDDENVTVTVSGVLNPSHLDWVAMISPSSSSVRDCPLNKGYYIGTGDISELPLLCHYPVKAQLLSNDPDYMGCKKQECKRYRKGICKLNACVGSLTFHVINIRTDIEFVFFTNGFDAPCILKRTGTVSFANPKSPLYGHLSNIDSKGESMRLTWASGDQQPQQVQYGNGQSQTSQVATFTKNDMWSGTNKNRTHHLVATPLKSPAADFGWHDPGYIHSAVMTGLQPSTSYSYRYGSDSVGWSDKIQFRTPPAGGSPELKFIAFGDMGKAPRDGSAEHYIQKGSISVVDAMAEEVASGNIDSIFHIGDISYATGFLVEWDFFLHQIMPVASHISYMTAIGNHERHRPMYSSIPGGLTQSVDPRFVAAVEPLLINNKVDLAMFGHVHNYERMCAVYQNECKGKPTKDTNGTETYDNSNYNAPVHVIIGMAGFALDKFPLKVGSWSLVRISQFGYTRFHATKEELKVEFVNSEKRTVEDSFRIIKS